jgi:hypothetical protein
MNNKQDNKKINSIVDAMKQSSGKYFSLRTKTFPRPINARFVRETPNYVTVLDRNSNYERKFSKRSLRSLNMGEVRF